MIIVDYEQRTTITADKQQKINNKKEHRAMLLLKPIKHAEEQKL